MEEVQKPAKTTKVKESDAVMVDTVKFCVPVHTASIGDSRQNPYAHAKDGFIMELLPSGFLKMTRKGNPNHILVPLANIANLGIKV